MSNETEMVAIWLVRAAAGAIGILALSATAGAAWRLFGIVSG
jgi:hypothetical protein